MSAKKTKAQKAADAAFIAKISTLGIVVKGSGSGQPPKCGACGGEVAGVEVFHGNAIEIGPEGASHIGEAFVVAPVHAKPSRASKPDGGTEQSFSA